MIQGIIFDCDGTLADTMPLHWRAWQVITARHRLHLPEDRFYALGGVPSRDILKMLSVEQVEPINLVVQIARAHAGKMPLAVASGGTKRIIEQVLDHLNIRPLFSAIVT